MGGGASVGGEAAGQPQEFDFVPGKDEVRLVPSAHLGPGQVPGVWCQEATDQLQLGRVHTYLWLAETASAPNRAMNATWWAGGCVWERFPMADSTSLKIHLFSDLILFHFWECIRFNLICKLLARNV